jgi:hypothetical protein
MNTKANRKCCQRFGKIIKPLNKILEDADGKPNFNQLAIFNAVFLY